MECIRTKREATGTKKTPPMRKRGQRGKVERRKDAETESEGDNLKVHKKTDRSPVRPNPVAHILPGSSRTKLNPFPRKRGVDYHTFNESDNE